VGVGTTITATSPRETHPRSGAARILRPSRPRAELLDPPSHFLPGSRPNRRQARTERARCRPTTAPTPRPHPPAKTRLPGPVRFAGTSAPMVEYRFSRTPGGASPAGGR
jgi:hypothetical protein